MEMDGRGFSELLRSTNEEILIKSMMDIPIGNPVPNMEMLGFKNIMQPFRADSEELFNNWLMNGESPASAITHRTCQPSTRISADLGLKHQNAVSFSKKSSNVRTSHQNFLTSDEHLSHPAHYSLRNSAEDGILSNKFYLTKAGFPQPLIRCRSSELRNSAEDGIQSSNSYLTKAEFPQPLIRSRSSELRRKHTDMQDSQVKVVHQAPHTMPAHDTHRFKEDFTNMSTFHNIPMAEMANQLQNFMSPSNSSTSFNSSIAVSDAIPSVVSMLKGTLEPKKIDSNADKETFEGFSYGMLTSQEAVCSISSIQGVENQATVFHILSPVHVPASGNLATIEKSLELSMKGFTTEANHMSTVSQEPSQSDSSTAAPTLSAGLEVCDGTAQSRPAFTTCSNSGIHVGYGSLELEFKDKEFRERMLENSFKDSKMKQRLAFMDSISSGASVGKEDSTKKRRVERSRKMADAKERNSTPSLSSDMQRVLKRWENLEKEVRSLKLNLSFMNRKDSEQTKQIEELQKQNEELTKEKERLLEEIEQNIS